MERKKLYSPDLWGTLLLIFLIFSRYVHFGYKYFPQLDDYIQYKVYRDMGISALIEEVGILGARPIAGLLDYFLWSPFWNIPIIAVLLISIALAVSLVLLKNIFSRYFRCGWLFLIFVCLIPSNFEASYWLSASSRIVMGLFFAVLSAFFLLKYLDAGMKKNALHFAIFQLISFGFYEQVLVFSLSLTAILTALEYKKAGKRCLLSLTSFANAILYFAFVTIFSSSALYSARSSVVLPVNSYYFKVFLPEVLSQIKSSIFGAALKISTFGALNGAKQIFTKGDIEFLFVLLISILSFVLFNKKCKEGSKEIAQCPWYITLFVGIVLTIAPMLPFFAVGNPWISLRSAFLSYIGIGIIIELCVDTTLKHSRFLRKIYLSICLISLCLFSFGSFSELYDYKLTYEADTEIIDLCTNTFSVEQTEDDICILGIEPSYTVHKNFIWHEHIHGVTESPWAMLGAYNSRRCNDGFVEIKSLVPMSLANESVYREWNYDTHNIGKFDSIYYYDKENERLIRLEREFANDSYVLRYRDSREIFGVIKEEGKIGTIYIEKNK
ncbi:MAG: hypothetical protein E7623_01680 [Ruminococcaceae bacterium]|nr:hypothetical protein [Oscillospiraceae bacterium]